MWAHHRDVGSGAMPLCAPDALTDWLMDESMYGLVDGWADGYLLDGYPFDRCLLYMDNCWAWEWIDGWMLGCID